MRIVGDLTLNHCGAGHDWFRAREPDPSSPERALFFFDGSRPLGYACWLGVRSLPTLNWSSPELRDRMDAVLRPLAGRRPRRLAHRRREHDRPLPAAST